MSQTRPAGRRPLAAVALAALLALPLPFLAPAAAQTTATLSPATITWDQFGVPHIQAETLESAVRALGYAQMEAHAELMLTNIARARGRAAEYIGPGQNGVNVQSDRFARAVGIPARAAQWLRDGSARQNAILDAFARGANEYAQGAGGATISPLLRQVLPITPADLHALTLYSIHYTFLTENADVPGQLAAWQAGQSAALGSQGGEGAGSNAFALAPTRTQSRNAILMGNPHLPFGSAIPIQGLELYQWFEAHLRFGETNAYGATFIGAPFIGIGFNRDLGWTHTNNTIDNADLYEVQLTPGGGYLFDGAVRPLEDVRVEMLRVRQPDGTVTEEQLTFASTVHGPLVGQRADGKALALRVAGLAEEGIVEQYWDMMLAGNLEQFQAAQRRLQMPFFNVMYADRFGEIFYLFGGRQPRRPYGTTDDWDGIIDGGTSATLWTDTLSFEELPQVNDPPAGVLHNCNDPPWTSTFPQVIRAEQYPAWVSPVEMFPRAQHCALALQSQRRFTADEVRRAKMSGRMLLADRVLGDLTKAGYTSTDPAARRGARVLQTWDRETRADSRGAVLFQRWFDLFVDDPAAPQGTWRGYPAFDVPWDPAKPLTTPRGLLDEGRAGQALAKAVRELEAQYGTPYVAWGQVNRGMLFGRSPEFFPTGPLADIAGNGGPGDLGTLRVAIYSPLGDGRSFFVGGDSYVQVVEFTPTGPRARTALTYGNSSRPGSPDITDQLRLFERRELRKVAFTPEEVAAAGVRTVTLPGAGS